MAVKKKKALFINAYFTIEAACIIPFLLIIFAGLIYFTFYQYTICLLNQDNYLLCFRGSVLQNTENGYGEIIYGNQKKVSRQEIYNDIQIRKDYLHNKYPGYISEGEIITVENNKISIESQGIVPVPFLGFLFSGKEGIGFNIKKDVEIPDPISSVRRVKISSQKARALR